MFLYTNRRKIKCLVSWGYKCDRITKIQKRAIRLINLSKYNAHTEPIFKQFKLLKVNHILQTQEFKFYHKFKNNTLPAYLQHLNLLPNSSIHIHNTRGKTDLHIHRTTHTFAKQCLTISGLQPCCSVTTADCIPWAFPKLLLISLQLHFSPRNTRFSNRNTLYILELE